MRSVAERDGSKDELYRRMGDNWQSNLRVAIPGIIDSFDAATQTVTVQPTIRERIRKEDGSQDWVELPLLVDVPIILPCTHDYAMTFPINKGTECLVIFADRCIDAWFSNGDIQNQIELRKHDLSDGFAIIGVFSQPNVFSNYSTESVQIRNKSGTSYIELKDNAINIVSPSVKINNKEFSTHTHNSPSGGGTTSGVL